MNATTNPLKEKPMTDQPTNLDLDDIAQAVASSFDQFEAPETRTARWEAAALAAGREVDRNALRAYMAVADAELDALAANWAHSVASTDAEIRRLRAELADQRAYEQRLREQHDSDVAELNRLRARVWELERPAVEAKRNEIRESYADLVAAAEETKDFEGAFDVQCRLREREEQWAREDAATPAP